MAGNETRRDVARAASRTCGSHAARATALAVSERDGDDLSSNVNVAAAIGGLSALFMQWLKLRATCVQLLLHKRAMYTLILHHLERRKYRHHRRLMPPTRRDPRKQVPANADSGGDTAPSSILEGEKQDGDASQESTAFNQVSNELRESEEEETADEDSQEMVVGRKRKKTSSGSPRVRKGYCTPRVRGRILEYIHSDAPDFRYQFRISRPTFDYLNSILQRETSHGWGQEIDLLVYLFWLKSGGSCTYTSTVFNMSKSTVINMVYRVQSVVMNHMASVIYLPKDDELEEVAEDFAEATECAMLDKVAGCIGRCHVRIRAPKVGESQYLNRHGWYSIQVQAVCDHRGAFRDVFIGYPGSASAAETLRASPLYQGALYPPEGYVLLGDESYPCLRSPITLITPFPESNVLSPEEEAFNEGILSARASVKRAFGLMKKRWQNVFTKILEVSTSSVPNMIAACAVLHNICLERGDIWDVDDQTHSTYEVEEVFDNSLEENEVDGWDLRRSLVDYL